jgi:hypothetical protein
MHLIYLNLTGDLHRRQTESLILSHSSLTSLQSWLSFLYVTESTTGLVEDPNKKIITIQNLLKTLQK